MQGGGTCVDMSSVHKMFTSRTAPWNPLRASTSGYRQSTSGWSGLSLRRLCTMRCLGEKFVWQ